MTVLSDDYNEIAISGNVATLQTCPSKQAWQNIKPKII